MIYPLAVMANTFAMTALLIALGVSGYSSLAADVGIVHGASLALFFAFTANARSLILSNSYSVSANSIMHVRLILLLPLSVVSYFLSVGVGVEAGLAIVLIVRRAVEWLGEVQLSQFERLGRKQETKLYLLVQSLLLVIAYCWLVFDMPNPYFGLWLWAILPLSLNMSAIFDALTEIPKSLSSFFVVLFPHIGSSAVIGITIYIFRLLLLYTSGKETAGDLFAAFAIGGLIGSVFANALGASITFHEQRSGTSHFPSFFRVALNGSLVGGGVLFITASAQWPILEMIGKSYLFWQAVGLSLIGGVVMVYAQRIRFRLLQSDKEHDVFGPDVMANILLLAAVPFSYYLFGRESLAGLYLLSAVLSFIFYLSSRMGEVTRDLSANVRRNIKLVIAIILLSPLYLQAGYGIFHDPSSSFESDGKLLNLPIPFAVFGCYLGIVLLGDYRRSYLSFSTIFLTFVLMMLSVIFSSTGDYVLQEAKLVLLLQYMLPMFALTLGQMYRSTGKDDVSIGVGKMFFWVLVVIVPLQIVSSWYQGSPYLMPSVFGIFSIYQYATSVPVIFASGYLFAIFALWDESGYQRPLFVLTLFVASYVGASLSILAISVTLIGLLSLTFYYWLSKKDKSPVAVFILAVGLSWGYFYVADHYYVTTERSVQVNSTVLKSSTNAKRDWPEAYITENTLSDQRDKSENVALGIQQLMLHWSTYLNGVISNSETFLFGNDARPDRSRYPGARNYYLDYLYNYGLIAFMPILVLLVHTCVLIYRYKKQIYLSSWLTGLSVVVLVLLFLDNSSGIGLRQPYPGIFTFFLWGYLLSNLLSLNVENNPT